MSSGLTLVAQFGGHYRFVSTPATLMGVTGTDDDSLKVHTFLAGARVVGRGADYEPSPATRPLLRIGSRMKRPQRSGER